MEERLQKVLARFGIASRRRAEELIRQGKVLVNNAQVTVLGTKVDVERDAILVEGKSLPSLAPLVYVLLNKPGGYVTTLRDPQGRPIVTDIVKDLPVRVFPVGRLDYDTEGLLLLTNDGDLSWKLQHPRFKMAKTYEVQVQGRPSPKSLARLSHGIVIDGRKTLPAVVRCLKAGSEASVLELRIREGRKRQIKRMCAQIGHPVLSLRRTAIGGITLDDLPVGRYRYLRADEIEDLKKQVSVISLTGSISEEIENDKPE